MNKKILFILVIMFFSSVILLQGNILFVDDIYLHFFDGGIHVIKNFCYGTWIMHLQNILMYCIPNFLNINIQEWALSFGVIFKSLIIALIILYYIKILKLKINDYKIVIPIAIILYLLIYISALKITIVDFLIYEGFFRFIIPALLMLMYFYYYLKYDINNKNNLLKLTILAVITASSSEIAAAITIITTLLLLLFGPKANNKKSILILLTSLITGALLLALTKGFNEHLLLKIDVETFSLSTVIHSVPDFFKVYYTKLIYNFKFYYTGLFILIILNILKGDKKEICLPTFLIASIHFFFITLICLGKTHYFGGYWIEHDDLYITTSYIYALSFILLLANYISNIRNNCNIIVSIILTVITIYMIYPFYNSTKYIHNTILNEKDYSYMRDKIRMFYAYKEQTAIMPPYSYLDSFWTLMRDYRIKIGSIDNYHILVQSYDTLENYYFINVYKYSDKFNNNYVIANTDKEAIEKFKENGGTLEEIETGKYKFSNLSNKDFVLNKL